MSVTDLIALALPAVPVALLILALRAKRVLDLFAPLQFLMLLCGAILAANATHTPGLSGAAATVLIAIVGLFATVLRKDHLAHRAIYGFDWEKFERDLQFWTIIADFR